MADDPDLLAGEYVLGTLEESERRAVGLRILTDPVMARAVADWQAKLSPLLVGSADVPPPTGLWARIEQATAAAPHVANDNRPLRRWQLATAAAVALAVVTAGLTMRDVPKLPSPTEVAPAPLPAGVQSVAALSETGGTPALLVSYDEASGRMKVIPVNVAPRPGHSLELWVIAGKAAPKSIGLMPSVGPAAIHGLTLDKNSAMTIAVSLEPKGGSPTGAPTGPVLYSGQMVSMPVS